jgi:hypothetical protein
MEESTYSHGMDLRLAVVIIIGIGYVIIHCRRQPRKLRATKQRPISAASSLQYRQ